jgi:hypothetical protein
MIVFPKVPPPPQPPHPSCTLLLSLIFLVAGLLATLDFFLRGRGR